MVCDSNDSNRTVEINMKCFHVQICLEYVDTNIQVACTISPTSPKVMKPGLRTFIISSRVVLI